MDILAQAQAIQTALSTWATSEGGKAFIASDLLHMWQVAYQNTQGVRAIVCFNGLTMRGGETYGAILGRADYHWKVALCRGRGYSAERSDSLLNTVVNARPFYTLVEEARDIIRAMQGCSVELPVDFRAISPMPMNEGSLVDGYLIDFTLVNDLPAIVDGTSELVQPYPVSLDSLYLAMPCVGTQQGGVCVCADPTPVSSILQGEPNRTYNVTLNIAGNIEGKGYIGGTNDGAFFQTGGTPATSDFNIARLTISDPPATYYLNRAYAGSPTYELYTATVPITTGATVEFSLLSVDDRELANVGGVGVPGYPGILPNLGQWMQIDATTFNPIT